MKQKYEFKRCHKTHLKELPNLVNKEFKIESNNDYFYWRFFENPVGSSFTVLVLFNGKVVGMLSSLPTKYQVCGNDIVGVQESDLVILEKYRRLDVFLKFHKFYLDILSNYRVPFGIGFTNKNSFALDLSGSSMINPVTRLVKILNAKPFIKKKIKHEYISKILSFFLNVALRVRYPNRRKISKGFKLTNIDHFDKRFDDLWEKLKNDYMIMTVRDSKYLNWRYVKSKGEKYKIVCMEAEDINEIKGFIVLGIKHVDGIKKGQIMDIFTPNKNECKRITICLLEYAIGMFHKMKVDAIECWMLPHTHIYNELIKKGFMLRLKESMHFHLRKIPYKDKIIDYDYISNINNWYITIGDFNAL